MIIDSSSLLPLLREKVRPTQSDASRHFLCPACKRRTKLSTLGDGRRKCSVCGKKFRVHKVTQDAKLRQCAEILLCFCLDFTALRTTQITHHGSRMVLAYYDHFRRLLTEKSVSHEKVKLLSEHTGVIETVHDPSRCRWCKSKIRSRDSEDQPPVFGVQLKESGEVFIDPLKDDEAVLHFLTFGSHEEAPGRREGYAGFICCGKFHRFTEESSVASGSAQVWTWIRERMRAHHGIWKRNTGFYLKELEWKYNNRNLTPEAQATKIIALIPSDFLTTWSLTGQDLEPLGA